MIEVQQLSKSFNGQKVLFDIDHIFEEGKVNLIIGQSGQGKSVLAKCIVGLYEADAGQILFDQRNFTQMDRSERSNIRQEIGMLFQAAALFDSMTVEQNVMFPLQIFVWNASIWRAAISSCRQNVVGACKKE